MKPPRAYLDTSFFTGLLENEENRQDDCLDVLDYEKQQGSEIYTSILTVNEFLVPYCDKYRNSPTLYIPKTDDVFTQIREIAWIYGIDDEVVRESARLMSVYGELLKKMRVEDPTFPRDRKYRWDSLHIASAHRLEADRVYGFDEIGMWKNLPKAEIPKIGQIIFPAKPPQRNFKASTPLLEYIENEEAKATDDGGPSESDS